MYQISYINITYIFIYLYIICRASVRERDVLVWDARVIDQWQRYSGVVLGVRLDENRLITNKRFFISFKYIRSHTL